MNEDSSFIALLSSFLMWEFGKGVESSNVRMYYVFGVWNRWRIIAWAWFINGKEINMFITCYCTVINFMWNAQDIYILMWRCEKVWKGRKTRCEIWMVVRKSVAQVQFPLNSCTPHFLSRWSAPHGGRTKNITKQNSLSDSRAWLCKSIRFYQPIFVIYETNLVTLQFVFHSFLPPYFSLFFFSSFLNKLLRSKGKREKKKLKSWNWIPVNSQMNKSKTDIFRFLQI